MPQALAYVGTAIYSYFGAAGAGAAAAGTGTAVAADTAVAGAATAAAGSVAGTAAGGAAVTAAAATSNAAIGAAGIAGIASPVSTGLGLTASELVTAATGASALYTLAKGPGSVNLPPSPGVPQSQDADIARAGELALKRAQGAGGLQSTLGTAGGAQGAILAPATTSNRSILGG